MDAFQYEVFSSAGEILDDNVRHSPALTGAVVEPPRQTIPAARSFELPKGVFVAMAAAYVAFLAEMSWAFGSGAGMPLVLAICVAYLLMYLGTPVVFARIETGVRQPKTDWSRLRQRGLQTAGGHMSVGAVLGQVLIVPACVAGFGLAVAIIIATL